MKQDFKSFVTVTITIVLLKVKWVVIKFQGKGVMF